MRINITNRQGKGSEGSEKMGIPFFLFFSLFFFLFLAFRRGRKWKGIGEMERPGARKSDAAGNNRRVNKALVRWLPENQKRETDHRLLVGTGAFARVFSFFSCSTALQGQSHSLVN